MRKHPVLLGIFLLFLVGLAFFLLVYALGSVTEDKQSFSLNNKVSRPIRLLEPSVSDFHSSENKALTSGISLITEIILD